MSTHSSVQHINDTIAKTERTAAKAEMLGMRDFAEFLHGAAQAWRDLRDDACSYGNGS